MTDTNSGNPFLTFTDADLKSALQRAFRTILILGLVLFVAVAVFAGWQSGMLLLAGAIISASGVFEAQRLIAAVNARLDHAERVQPMGQVIAMFFLRLMIAGAILYVSLKCFHGSIYALIAGLCLAILGLSIEAVKFIRV